MSAPGGVRLTSAVGLLAMLEEQEAQIKAHALKKLNAVVPDFWAEIAESLPDIESLYEDEAFAQRQLAALVASKVYFYLGELKDALEFALGAGSLFDVEEGSDFVETLLSKGIDEYCALYVKRSEQALAVERGGAAEADVVIDPRLVELVERLVASSLQKRAYQAVMGIALESRRLEMVEQVIRLCDDSPGEHEHEGSTGAMLAHTFNLCSTTVSSYDFRRKVLAVLEDADENVRWEVLRALPFLVESGNEPVAGALLLQLQNEDSLRRRMKY